MEQNLSIDTSKLSGKKLAEVVDILEELERRKKLVRINEFYPDDGPLSRHEYTKHMQFFEAGAEHNERLMLAANRVGKTEGVGGYETTLHLTGEYPEWWSGKRFDHPISAWAAGKSNETTRDIIQYKMLGQVLGSGGTKRLSGGGLIPGNKLGKPTWRSGIQNLVDTVPVKHINGGWSYLGLKSYEQGRGSFEGTEKHVIWLDEEPPLDVYSECLIRTMTVDGHILCTFTPLEGMSQVVMHFLPGGRLPDE